MLKLLTKGQGALSLISSKETNTLVIELRPPASSAFTKKSPPSSPSSKSTGVFSEIIPVVEFISNGISIRGVLLSVSVY